MYESDTGPERPPDGSFADPAAPADDAGNSFASLREDVSALVDDARNYAAAELAFQRTRAGLAGKHGARALVLLVLALLLLHLALIALAVGAVIALAPLVTIWGAIAIVVGVMLVGVAALVLSAVRDGKAVGAMFEPGDKP